MTKLRLNGKQKFLAVFFSVMVLLAVFRHVFKPEIPSYDNLTAQELLPTEEPEAMQMMPGVVPTAEADTLENDTSATLDKEAAADTVPMSAAEQQLTASLSSDSSASDTAVNKNTALYRMSGKIWDYDECLPDTQEQHIAFAERLGIKPVSNHKAILSLARKHKLVSIMDSPFYAVEELKYSMPYLVPSAKALLTEISINFLDSLKSKGYPLYLPIVTSVTRTTADVEKLTHRNRNATENSCHSYGTTFDITYSRYMPLTGLPTPIDSAEWKRSEIKLTLAEVLYDLRSAGKCLVKHERRQPCFHITVAQ